MWIWGILAATPSPASTSRVFTWSITGARSRVTESLLICTAPLSLPVRALTSAVWIVRFASVHTVSKAFDATTSSALSCTKLRTAPSSPLPSFPNAFCSSGRWSGATSSSSLGRSMCSMTAPVTRFATAACTSGLEASGATVVT